MAFVKKGASNQLLGVLAAFLTKRCMRVKVGNELSEDRAVNAGAPQGSVLGCFLFKMGVDDLEEEFLYGGSTGKDSSTETLM